jgi:Fic family protein
LSNKEITMLHVKLKAARQQAGLSLKALSAQSGVDIGLLSKYESNQRLPSAAQLEALSAALQMPLLELKRSWQAERVYQLLQDEDDFNSIVQEARTHYNARRIAKQDEQVEAHPELQHLLKEVADLQRQWQLKRPLSGTQLLKMQEYFRGAYTYESNRIEGNRLTFSETHLVINEGITIAGKSMREHLEAINHAEAVVVLEELVQQQTAFSRHVLFQLHGLILRQIDRDNGGRYRRVPVRISGSNHIPPQPWQLDSLMDIYFGQYEQLRTQLHPVLLAAEMHEQLVSIHPFIDGNGRTSRLVMNLILLQNGYTIANIKGDLEHRMAYYQALEAVRTEGSKLPFYRLVLEASIASLREHLAMC